MCSHTVLYVCTYVRTYLRNATFVNASLTVVMFCLTTYILPMYVHSVYMLMNLCMYARTYLYVHIRTYVHTLFLSAGP